MYFLFTPFILVASNLMMGLSKSLPGAIIGSFLMEIGYSLSTCAPSSIISVVTIDSIHSSPIQMLQFKEKF